MPAATKQKPAKTVDPRSAPVKASCVALGTVVGVVGVTVVVVVGNDVVVVVVVDVVVVVAGVVVVVVAAATEYAITT